MNCARSKGDWCHTLFNLQQKLPMAIHNGCCIKHLTESSGVSEDFLPLESTGSFEQDLITGLLSRPGQRNHPSKVSRKFISAWGHPRVLLGHRDLDQKCYGRFLFSAKSNRDSCVLIIIAWQNLTYETWISWWFYPGLLNQKGQSKSQGGTIGLANFPPWFHLNQWLGSLNPDLFKAAISLGQVVGSSGSSVMLSRGLPFLEPRNISTVQSGRAQQPKCPITSKIVLIFHSKSNRIATEIPPFSQFQAN